MIQQRDVIVVADELIRGQKIGAIKKLREFTNLGLKESKDIIDMAVNGYGRGYKPEDMDYDDIMFKLTKALTEIFPTQVAWEQKELVIDEKSVEALIAINMAVLAEIKEMNELLRDVMEGME